MEIYRFMTHSLAGGGPNNRGYDALHRDLLSTGFAGSELGQYMALCFLPDKVARFLYEFHEDNYGSLGLPVIPDGASSGKVHKMLKISHVIPQLSIT